jgi:KUP system potassium uptake protein
LTDMTKKESLAAAMVKALGLVFGDIGTSPIYTLSVVFLLTRPTPEHVIGVLSLIVWTLAILVSVEYAWLAMSLGERGENGTIVLKTVLVRLLKRSRQAAFVTLLSFLGISLLIGDGVITPAISILSAVEGLLLVPGFEQAPRDILTLIACGIAVALFAFQHKGTEKIAGVFGPLMLIWFLTLMVSGVFSIVQTPAVAKAVNPYFAVRFLLNNGITGFFILSEVILCATGGEALYADMGQLGRKPIVRAWYFVFGALLLNYLGQGAHLIRYPDAQSVLFEMILHQVQILYVPFLILSILATVIASQAMISGMFSIVYQAITTHVLPRLKVDYTSPDLRSQIYIGAVNWFLLIAVLLIMFEFRESHRLAAAYGLAVTGTMTLTGIMMTWIFYLKGQPVKFFLSIFVTLVDAVYLLSNSYKIPHGGYWSLILAAVPFALILIYTGGQRRLYRSLRRLNLEHFLEKFNAAYRSMPKIKGTALFFLQDAAKIPPYIVKTMFTNDIIYEDNILISIRRKNLPFGIAGHFKPDLAPGLRIYEINAGYMEVVAVERLMKNAGINEKTIFYGLEDIATKHFVWQIFSLIKRVSPTFIQFHKLPAHKLHGVVTRVEI